MTRTLPLWRSMLFVPITNERFLAGAPSRGADAIQLDLEDSIPPDHKEEARSRVRDAAAGLATKGIDVVVRINRPWRQAIRDIEASVCQAVSALTLPKVPDARHVVAIGEILDELERERGLPPGHTGLVAMIETAEGLAEMRAIAAAPRVLGITVGAEDLAVSMGMVPDVDSLYVPNVMAVAAARAAGCLPIGYIGSVAGFTDLDAYRQVIRRARRLGFVGGFCIHPAQVAILNEEFAPSSAEVEEAMAIVAAFEAGLREGRGAVRHNGRMLDLPVVEQARALIARRQLIERQGANS
ncbi:HpcH/HpaI aldolase/citrate lyase family protein [Arenibaculum pallidiluteum]|uniref:HpcH/HpaI aldolase/citrate lyase family protein n=1 Tax=Arenibaculum pallidiluteum TaxID=2812559 RepID=UPI001A96F15C|nr:CoA ester lyase [Arenibaculum pallidiluteum]